MPVALKKEAIAVASGNNVYLYSYSGNVRRLAERPGEVMSLAVYRGQLLDSGDYKGIRNTLEGGVAFGKNARWRRIAAWKRQQDDVETEMLYGAMETDDKVKYGIYELASTADYGARGDEYPLYQRNGKTNVLAGLHLLADGGGYYWFVPDREPHLSVGWSHDHCDEPVAWGECDEMPVTSAVSYGDWLYFTTPTSLKGKNIRLADWTHRGKSFFSLKTPFTELLHQLEIAGLEKGEIGWHKYCKSAERINDILPEKIVLMDCSNLDADSRWRFRESVEAELKRHIIQKEGLSAIAYAEDRAFAGCMNGDLIMPYTHLQERNNHVLYNFNQAVSALHNVPEEMMGGLRRWVTRSIQMRAVHASGARAKLKKAA